HRTAGYECGALLISYNPDGSSNWTKETSGLNISGSGLGVYIQFQLNSQNQPVIGIQGENEDFQKNVKILQYNEEGDLIREKNYTKEANGLFSLNALIGLGISDSNDFTIVMEDRKSTRLNSSHVKISYAVFCLKKTKKLTTRP